MSEGGANWVGVEQPVAYSYEGVSEGSANPHLYVHNVPKDSDEDELRSVFGQYGQVENVRLKINQKVGPNAVYAFVTFASTEEAQNALKNLQGKDIRGRALRIEFQRTKDTKSDSYPSNKRPRFATSQLQKYVPASDLQALLEALQQLINVQRPELLDQFRALRDALADSRWHLSAPLQKMAAGGALELDNTNKRWNVKISQLLPPNSAPVVLPPATRNSYQYIQSAPCGRGFSDYSPAPAPADSTKQDSVWISKFNSIPQSRNKGPEIINAPCWAGLLARNEKKQTTVHLFGILGDILHFMPPINDQISVSLRSPYEEMLKKEFLAVGCMHPSAEANSQAFAEYVNYFQEKNRAGVVRVPGREHLFLYVLPISVPGVKTALAHVCSDYILQPPVLVTVVVANSD